MPEYSPVFKKKESNQNKTLFPDNKENILKVFLSRMIIFC